DIQRAIEEGRDPKNLGSDIMIHGKAASAGCLAIGDPAIEELFLLCADTGLDAIELIIAPCDLRTTEALHPDSSPPWTTRLHQQIKDRLPGVMKSG
ncbi:MAG: L,D-transpeptidase, partial [Terrimicrobiaceae bacterium]